MIIFGMEEIENDNVIDFAEEKEKRNSAKIPQLPVLRLADAFATELLPRDYVLPSLPRGKVGMLAAAGGTGKSFWTLQACLQVATSGCCSFDLSGAEMSGGAEKIGSTLLVSMEDESEDLIRRLNSIRDHWVNASHQREWIEGIAEEDLFQMLPLAGEGIALFGETGEPNAYVSAIERHAKSMSNLRLVVVDTFRRCHDGDENSNGLMSKVLRTFEQLAKTLNASILLLHHENKASMSNSDAGAGALRGASSIVDNARWVMRMQVMTKADADQRGIVSDDIRKTWVRVTNEKSNYGPIQPEKWLLRVEGGVLIKSIPPAIIEQKNGRGRGNV